jgi:transposase
MIEEMMEAAQGRHVRIMFEDEARFGRISNPRRCWAPYPIRPLVKTAIVQEFTYVYGACSPEDGTLDTLILPEINALMMSIFLAEVADRHQEDFIIMIMDRAGWHTAKALKIPENIHIASLPPYSPELNPVEHIWDDVREKEFPNRVFASIDALEDHLMHGLATIE